MRKAVSRFIFNVYLGLANFKRLFLPKYLPKDNKCLFFSDLALHYNKNKQKVQKNQQKTIKI